MGALVIAMIEMAIEAGVIGWRAYEAYQAAQAMVDAAELAKAVAQYKAFLKEAVLDNLMSADERVMLDGATKLVNISSVNTKGYAAIEDDTIGEETSRQRRISFCLLHEPKSICGGGFVGMLNDPKSDLTEHALDILRTIEFLPDVPAAEPVKSQN